MSPRITLKSSLIALAVAATLACCGNQARAQSTYAGSFALKNWGTGMYMEDAYTSIGGPEFQNTVFQNSTEVYAFYVLPNGSYAIINTFSGLALTDMSFAGMTTAEQYGFGNGPYQQWRVIYVIDGSYAIVNVATGKALTAPSYSDFSDLITYPFFYSELQLWFLD